MTLSKKGGGGGWLRKGRKVCSVRGGRHLGDCSSNVVLTPSPTFPDEEATATGGKVVGSFVHSTRCLLSTYYKPHPVLRGGARWKGQIGAVSFRLPSAQVSTRLGTEEYWWAVAQLCEGTGGPTCCTEKRAEQDEDRELWRTSATPECVS